MMLLGSLNDLYDKLVAENRLPPVGYQLKPVRFIVDLDTTGRCLGIVDTGPDQTVRLVPDVSRAGTKAPAFIGCDNGHYVLGIPKRVGDETKALTCHTAFLDRLNEAVTALAATDSSASKALGAIADFASDRDHAIGEFRDRGIAFEHNSTGELPDASARIAFIVDGVDPVELPAVREWWAQIANSNISGSVQGLCQVAGTRSELARIMPGLSVKPGTPQALISANFVAAERYNAKQSGGARISVPVAIRSHQALNWLLSEKHHRQRIGDLTFVWWLDADVDFDPFNIIAQPHEDDVAALLGRPWSGRLGLSPSDSFRLVGLSLTEGRIVIRLDHVSTLAEVERRTRRWLELIARPGRDGKIWRPAIGHLADAAVPPGEGNARKKRRDRVIEALARAAVAGTPLPRSLLAALVDRCRAVPIPRSGTGVDWSAIGARLACLNLYVNVKEDRMNECRSVGDLCGRTLAQLEAAQYAALGDINRTLVERYYAGASTMPGTVFSGLFKTAIAHLGKAGRQGRKGAQIAISRRLGELSDLLKEAGGFPATLSMEQQADFALGYWSERQARFQRSEIDAEATNPEEE